MKLTSLIGLIVLLIALLPAFSRAQTTEAADLFVLINNYRIANGLNPLVADPSLMASAQFKSEDMATNNYFSHTASDGRSFFEIMEAHGFSGGSWTGENIAAGSSTAEGTLNQWINSEDHNAILLSPVATVGGTGYAFNENSEFGHYWTFHVAATEVPVPTEPPAPEPTATEAPVEPTATVEPPDEPTPGRGRRPSAGVPTVTPDTPTEVPVVPTATPIPPTQAPVFVTTTPVPTATSTPAIMELPSTGTGSAYMISIIRRLFN